MHKAVERVSDTSAYERRPPTTPQSLAQAFSTFAMKAGSVCLKNSALAPARLAAWYLSCISLTCSTIASTLRRLDAVTAHQRAIPSHEALDRL